MIQNLLVNIFRMILGWLKSVNPFESYDFRYEKTRLENQRIRQVQQKFLQIHWIPLLNFTLNLPSEISVNNFFFLLFQNSMFYEQRSSNDSSNNNDNWWINWMDTTNNIQIDTKKHYNKNWSWQNVFVTTIWWSSSLNKMNSNFSTWRITFVSDKKIKIFFFFKFHC